MNDFPEFGLIPRRTILKLFDYKDWRSVQKRIASGELQNFPKPIIDTPTYKKYLAEDVRAWYRASFGA